MIIERPPRLLRRPAMAYAPLAPTMKERDRWYLGVAIGGGSALATLVLRFVDLDPKLWGFFCLFTAANAVGFVVSNRADEHFSSLRDVGCRWASAAVALWMVVVGFIGMTSLARQFGHLLGSNGSSAGEPLAAPPVLADAMLLGSLAMVAFYAGFLVAYVRCRKGY